MGRLTKRSLFQMPEIFHKMETRSDKSANQLYKEERRSGRTSLDFKTWLNVQKAKKFSNLTGAGAIPVNAALNNPIQDVLDQIHQEGGLQTQAGTTYIFGINKQALIWTGVGLGVLITGLIIYKVMHRR
jgi:hypothetical protein